jgi:importin subunit beta-1
MEYVYPALAVLDEFQVFTTAVGLTGDLARAVGKGFGAYAQNILQALLAALASPVLHRTAKPTVVAAFGDIGLALETDFTPYLEHVMSMLSQAGAIQVDASQDLAMSDFIWQMREAIADAFVGIVNGYQSDREWTLLHTRLFVLRDTELNALPFPQPLRSLHTLLAFSASYRNMLQTRTPATPLFAPA